MKLSEGLAVAMRGNGLNKCGKFVVVHVPELPLRSPMPGRSRVLFTRQAVHASASAHARDASVQKFKKGWITRAPSRVGPDSRLRVEGPPFSFALVQAFFEHSRALRLNVAVGYCMSVLSDLVCYVGNPTLAAFDPEFLAKWHSHNRVSHRTKPRLFVYPLRIPIPESQYTMASSYRFKIYDNPTTTYICVQETRFVLRSLNAERAHDVRSRRCEHVVIVA
jgi:hypothetical protein